MYHCSFDSPGGDHLSPMPYTSHQGVLGPMLRVAVVSTNTRRSDTNIHVYKKVLSGFFFF